MRFIITSLFIFIGTSGTTNAIEDLHIKGLFKNTAIVSIDGKRRVLKVGKVSPEGVLLIEADSEKALIEIDDERQTYRLSQRVSNSFKAAPKKASVHIPPNQNGMYFVNGSINDFQVKFLIDTGATNIAMSEQHAKRLGINYKLSGLKGHSSTASGKAVTWMVKLKKVKVGQLSLRDVNANVIKGDHPETILLGNSYLNKVKMVRNGKMMELHSR